jgi:hypothetical protein
VGRFVLLAVDTRGKKRVEDDRRRRASRRRQPYEVIVEGEWSRRPPVATPIAITVPGGRTVEAPGEEQRAADWAGGAADGGDHLIEAHDGPALVLWTAKKGR